MNIQLSHQGFIRTTALLLLLGVCSGAYAKTKDCWVDIYDDTQFKGKQYRVNGPAHLNTLFKVNGVNWDKKIESIIVGPKASVIVFENKNFKLTLAEMANHPVLMKSLGISKQDILEESELIFGPNSKIHGLGEFRFYHKIRSLKLNCTQ